MDYVERLKRIYEDVLLLEKWRDYLDGTLEWMKYRNDLNPETIQLLRENLTRSFDFSCKSLERKVDELIHDELIHADYQL